MPWEGWLMRRECLVMRGCVAGLGGCRQSVTISLFCPIIEPGGAVVIEKGSPAGCMRGGVNDKFYLLLLRKHLL
jgi:hypothetical protein